MIVFLTKLKRKFSKEIIEKEPNVVENIIEVFADIWSLTVVIARCSNNIVHGEFLSSFPFDKSLSPKFIHYIINYTRDRKLKELKNILLSLTKNTPLEILYRSLYKTFLNLEKHSESYLKYPNQNIDKQELQKALNKIKKDIDDLSDHIPCSYHIKLEFNKRRK